MNALDDFRARLAADVLALETLDEELEGLPAELAEQLELTRVILRQTDDAIHDLQNPARRRRTQPPLFLRDEPTPERDELAVTVLHDVLGAKLANSPTAIGLIGPSRVMWDPNLGALNFIDRADFVRMRRASELELARIVVLDAGRSKHANWADLPRLVGNSPARVRHIAELCRVIVNGTQSLTLLRQWVQHPDVKGDPAMFRVVHLQLQRVEAAAAAE